MADGGQIMSFKLDSNEILLYNCPPCALNWNLMNTTNRTYNWINILDREKIKTSKRRKKNDKGEDDFDD